jgi:hypothetical protein
VSSPGRDARRGAEALLLLAAVFSSPTAAAQRTPQPIFTELFAYDPVAPSQLLGGLAGGCGGDRAWWRRAQRAGELVKFGELVWYRFSFKVASDWPQDIPVAGRQPCRTVIHQIKQDSFKVGKSCDASPFFKIEARPLGEHTRDCQFRFYRFLDR